MRALLLTIMVVLSACERPGIDPQPDAGTAVDARSIDAPTPIDAPTGTVCAAKNPLVQLIYTCQFVWSQCGARADHEINCTIQAAGSLRFSLCDCKVGGVQVREFASTTICDATSWPELEATANEQCGWDLR